MVQTSRQRSSYFYSPTFCSDHPTSHPYIMVHIIYAIFYSILLWIPSPLDPKKTSSNIQHSYLFKGTNITSHLCIGYVSSLEGKPKQIHRNPFHKAFYLGPRTSLCAAHDSRVCARSWRHPTPLRLVKDWMDSEMKKMDVYINIDYINIVGLAWTIIMINW